MFISQKIPFSMNNIQTKTTDLFSMIDEVLQVFPEAVVCQACGNGFEGEAEPLEQTCYFLTKYECVPTKVYQRMCKGCNSCNNYDGQLDCVFNMDRFLIHYEVLRDFMFHFLYSIATMFSFYSVWIQHQADNGNSHFSTLFPYMYFRQSWFCSLSLLDIDYIHDFVCKDCGPRPEILLFDGTSLSFKKSFLPPEPVIDSKATKFFGSSHEERVFVKNRATRDLLHKYSQLKNSIEPEEFKSLKSLLSIHQPALVPLLEAFENVGICYGFEVMECAESPNRPFTFLKTRFEKAPAVIIYDNACNLHQYCLNRDPVFFSNTLMVVDGLHWDNHSGCSVGYKALDYPILRGINTQTVEQNNSKLKKLKSSLSYMTSKHFMDSLTFFMWHSNKTVKRN